MSDTPQEPLSDDDITTAGAADPSLPGVDTDADGTDGDAVDTTDGDASDSVGDAADADGTDADGTDGGDADGTDA